MKVERERPIDARARAALTELKKLIRKHYPEATFAVRREEDDADCIHLVTAVDVEDGGEVIEAVLDRMMEIQIEEDLPIFVIPVRPRERALEQRPEARATSEQAGDVTVVEALPTLL